MTKQGVCLSESRITEKSREYPKGRMIPEGKGIEDDVRGFVFSNGLNKGRPWYGRPFFQAHHKGGGFGRKPTTKNKE